MVVVEAVPLTLIIMGGTLKMMDQQLGIATALPISASPATTVRGTRAAPNPGRRPVAEAGEMRRYFALPRCRSRACYKRL